MKKTDINVWRKVGMWVCLFLILGAAGCDKTINGLADAEEADDYSTTKAQNAADFNTTFAARHYEGWDANKDKLLDEKEYGASLYDAWDTDNDGQVNESEWKAATNDFNLEDQNWSDWDAGGDGALDENEFRSGLSGSGWYGAWDADHDNMLSEREYSDGVFGLWDENQDGELEEEEAAAYDTYYGN